MNLCKAIAAYPVCACGCGCQTTLYRKRFRKYIHGHNARGVKREWLSASLRKRWAQPGERKRFSELMQGRKITWAHKISASIKKQWASLSEKDRSRRILASLSACSLLRPNNSEKKLWKILRSEFPGEFKMNVQGHVIIGGKIPDFVNVNGKKLLVEMFGTGWHKPAEENQRKKHFRKWGFRTIIVWQNELKDTQGLAKRLGQEIFS